MSDSQSEAAQVDPGLILNSAALDMRRGHLDEARRKLGQAEGVYRHMNDRIGLAMALYNSGVVSFRTGHHEDAAVHFSEAVELFGQSQWSVGATVAEAGARRAQPSSGVLDSATGGDK